MERYQMIVNSGIYGIVEKGTYKTIKAAKNAIKPYQYDDTIDGAAIYDLKTKRCIYLFDLFHLEYFSSEVQESSNPKHIYGFIFG